MSRRRTLVRSVRRVHTAIPITEDQVGRIIEGIVAPLDTMSGLSPQSREEEKERVAQQAEERATFPRLEVRPSLRRLLVAQDGAFWIERIDGLAPVEPEIHRAFGNSSRAASRSIWDIFNREGRFQGTVVLPPRSTPMVVEERAVVGVEKDALDVESVVRFRVVPS